MISLQQWRTRYKPFIQVRFIDRCLARKPEQLIDEELGFVAQWHQEDLPTKYIYQALNHIRYVLKATTMTQAKRRRLTEWFKRYQFHLCSAISKIAKTLETREKALLDTLISPLSNGMMESKNNKIKLIKRRDFGYRNEDRLFLCLRLETGR